jgi:sporulation protein YlmC with PRC-barrel domain
MLLAGSRLINAPVMGLQTGSELARTSRAIIDPRTLEIVAYELTGPLLDLHPSVLRVADVREFSDIGLIVDSSDEFISPGDVIKLNEIYTLNFKLIGMSVIDENRHKVGKVDGYTIETGGFVVQQLSVKRPLLKSLGDAELLVHRSQITEINSSTIIIHSEIQPPEPVMQTVKSAYTNPFRKAPGTQAGHTTSRQ